MAVSFRGVGSRPSSTSGAHTSLTPTLPTGTAAGDYLFCVVDGDSTTGSGLPVWSISGTWNNAGQLSQVDPFVGTQTNVVQLFWKVARASESAPTVSYVSGSEGSRLARIHGFSGARSMPTAVSSGSTTGSSYTPATLSGPVDGMGIVLAVARSSVFSGTSGSTANGWTPTRTYAGTVSWGDLGPPAPVIVYKATTGGSLTMPVLLGQFTTAWQHWSCVLSPTSLGGIFVDGAVHLA